MNLTDADVAEIIRILDASGYGELELETERFRLVLKREGDGWSQQRETLSEPHEAHPAAPQSQGQAPAAGQEPGAESVADAGLLEVRAPIVGTFYRAPAPGATPFVEVGSPVGPDTVVAIIEVMKLMNSVPAEVSGVVAEICVDDAEQVEQDQLLMRVRPEES